MTLGTSVPSRVERPDAALSLYHLLDPEVLANPYPLFHRLRREDPVHWDVYLHAWIVTRYPDVMEVLHSFSANRTPTPEQLTQMGLSNLNPIAQLMVKQMLFMDASVHTRLRGLASKAFTPARVETLKAHIRDIVNHLLDQVESRGHMDVIADLADPLPAIVTAELLGLPVSDHPKLKTWSANFAEMLGNFQHNPDRAPLMLRTVEEMTSYFRDAVQEIKAHPRDGLIHSMLTAEIDGDRLTEEEVIANVIVTMVGGQETTTNLIGNGLLTLLRHPDQMKLLCDDLSLIPSAVEEMLRFESPSQHTARLAPSDRELGGKQIKARQAVIAIMAAANRDPERFPDPDRFDIKRLDNRHLAFGYAAHFCFGAPLARAEGQIAFELMLRRLQNIRLEPQSLQWRNNLGLRGLTSLKISFGEQGNSEAPDSGRNEPRTVTSQQKPSLAPVMNADETRRILFDWNQTESDYPADKCIHQLIEAQAERTPDAIAVVYGKQTLTYREFNERANQLALYLRKLGVGPDVPVGICLPSSVSLAVCFLAVLKANGACLPLDPAYPKDRLQFMVQDARIPVLLSNEALSADLAVSGVKVVCIDSAWESIAKESRNNPENTIAPENLAYLIYTSGSTGTPKGVMLPHRGLVNYVTMAVKLYGLTPADRQLQFSSISFDIAIEEMYPTWAAGATLVLRSQDFSLAGSEFLRWARQQKITVMTVATAYWHELVHELSETNAALPESLRLVIVGGEKAQLPALEAWRKAAGTRVRWINTYGPTEASVIATAYELSPSGPLPSPLPIGRPVSNTRVYILDENLQPVPAGESGELHIGGAGLARGYLNAPDLTAAKFIRDPFSLDPNAKLYKTGDLARYLPDGQIEFVGRRDFQVKIRGFRVEPGEIESVLMRHAAVRQAVVLVQEDANGKRLIGYVVPVAGETVRAAEIRNYLKGELPEYMVPAAFVSVNELPLTPNGKVDRRALAALPIDETPAEDYAAPTDPTETKLAGMWEDLLGKKPVGIRDNFFELGGHSLLAVRLMRQIEQAFHRKLPLVTLFEAPTIEQLAAILRKEQWVSSFALAIPIQPLGGRPPFFCVHGLGGAVLRFKDLARHMAPDQPFYGIQPPGMDGEAPLLRTVEEMATCYIGEMKKVQPEGPYYIGGYSFGGLVAFEMARQLGAAGEEVAFLGLLDTYPGRPKTTAMLLSTLLKLPREAQIAYVQRKLTKYRRGLRRRFDSVFLPKALKEVRNALAKAEMDYKPQTYFGSATWLRASEKTLRGADNPQDDWSAWVAGGVEIQEIDGDHGSIMNEPTVAVFATTLRNCLAKAQQKYSEVASSAIPVEACD